MQQKRPGGFGGGFEPPKPGLRRKLQEVIADVPRQSRALSLRYARGLLGKELGEREALLVAGGSAMLLIAIFLAALVAGTGSKQITTRRELHLIQLVRIDGETNDLYVGALERAAGELVLLGDPVESNLFDRTDRLLRLRGIAAADECVERGESGCAAAAEQAVRLIAVDDEARMALSSFSAEPGSWVAVRGSRVGRDESSPEHNLRCAAGETCLTFEGFAPPSE